MPTPLCSDGEVGMGHPDAHVPSLLLAGSGLVLISAGVICVWRPWVAALCDPLMSPPNCVTRDYEETSRQRAPGQCLTGEWLGDVPCVWRKIQGLGITSDGKLGSAWPMIPYLSWVWTGAPCSQQVAPREMGRSEPLPPPSAGVAGLASGWTQAAAPLAAARGMF